jgi:hypothetical protein
MLVLSCPISQSYNHSKEYSRLEVHMKNDNTGFALIIHGWRVTKAFVFSGYIV